MNLVLDLEGTLVNATDSLDKVIARPYLDRFLYTSFRNFASVSIWTSSSEFWCKYILENIIDPILQSISIGMQCTFKYVLHDIHCSRYVLPNGVVPIKPIEQWFDMNTIVVDDSPYIGLGGIYIPTFVSSDDRMLLYLEQYLYDLLNGNCTLGNPWYTNIPRMYRANIIASQYRTFPDYMDMSD